MFSRKKACKGKLKGIVRKESQSFTNHGHDKTPPAVFNPLSPWLTLPRDMGVSHTLWPPSITRATLACLWFAQGLHRAPKNQNSRAILARLWFAQGLYKAPKIKTTEPFLRACGLHRVCTGFAQGAKNQNSRAILARLWFAQGLSKAPKNKIADQFTLLPASFARPTCIWR